MTWKCKVGCVAALAGLFAATTASAGIVAAVDPDFQIVNEDEDSVTINIVADIPEEDQTIGWGLDLDFGTPGVVGASWQSVSINQPLFEPVGTPDGDGLAGWVPAADPPVWGENIVLATVTLSIDSVGETDLILSDDNPADLSEGFALVPPPAGGFAEVDYLSGHVVVIPEPVTLTLLACGILGLIRRRASC